MSIYDLACKYATSFALASCHRISTIHSLKADYVKFLHDKVVVCFSSLHKQSKPVKHLNGIEMHRFSNDENVCVVNILAAYNEAVTSKREECKLT